MMWRLWDGMAGCIASPAARCCRFRALRRPSSHAANAWSSISMGWVEARGVAPEGNGEVVKRFQVQIDASWQGERGVLDESFL